MLKPTLYFGVAAIFGQLGGLILTSILTRTLSISEFAQISILEATATATGGICIFAIERAAQRFYFDVTDSQKESIFSNALAFSIFSVLFIACAWIIGSFFINKSQEFFVYSIGMVCGFLLAINGLGLVYTQVTEKYWFHLLCGAIKGLFPIFIFVLISMYSSWNFKSYVVAICFTYLLLGLIAIRTLPSVRHTTIEFTQVRAMLVYSSPFIIASISASFITVGGRFILQAFSTQEQLAIYSFWFKLSLIMLLVPTALNAALTPKVFNLLSLRNGFRVVRIMNLPIRRLYFSTALFFLLISPWLGLILGGGNFDFKPLLCALLFSTHYVSSCNGAISDLQLFHRKVTRIHSVIFLFGASFTLLISSVFGSFLGAYGPGIGSLAGLFAVTVLHHFYLSYRFGYNINILADLLHISIIILFGYGMSERILFEKYFNFSLLYVQAFALIVVIISNFKLILVIQKVMTKSSLIVRV
jgi:O-antigen/teichoic acid export membrane protein